MPAWQRFLGKVFLSRADRPTLVGFLIALSGINGNVAGTYRALRTKDPAVPVIEGNDLQRQLSESGELMAKEEIRAQVRRNFGRDPTRSNLPITGADSSGSSRGPRASTRCWMAPVLRCPLSVSGSSGTPSRRR